MKGIGHPSDNIDPVLVQNLRDHSVKAELLKQLHSEQLKQIYDQKWFQLFIPKKYNGLELSLPDALRLEESLAWTYGSIGWTVTLCAGAGWFIGFLDPELIKDFFNDNKVCLSGSGKSSGIAKKVTDGYEITGHWSSATGASHATMFTANCVIEENGSFFQNEDGSPLIQSFLFLTSEVTILRKWESIGMKAMGSFSFEVNHLVIPESRAFMNNREEAFLPHPIYQYPFLSFAELTLAVNSSGMAVRFFDLCQELISNNINNTLRSYVDDAI